MPFYHSLGKIPPKRHTQFRKPDGSLYAEQLFGTIGFDGMYSNSYHEHRPTQVKAIKNSLSSYGFSGQEIDSELSDLLWHEYFIYSHSGQYDNAKKSLMEKRK